MIISSIPHVPAIILQRLLMRESESQKNWKRFASAKSKGLRWSAQLSMSSHFSLLFWPELSSWALFFHLSFAELLLFPFFPFPRSFFPFPSFSKLLFPASQLLLPTLFSLLANAHLWPISYFSKVFSPFFPILRFCPFGNCWLMYCNEQGHKQLFLLTSLTSRSKRMCFLKISHNLATRWPVQ